MLRIPEKIAFLIDCLTQNGYEAYIVGGCVRDSLLGLTPSDYDVTTSAKPEEIIAIFEKTIPTGLKHGTVTVLIQNEPIEVTAFRTEGNYADSRHPKSVEFVTDLRQDLSRRDFTVNAIAYSEKTGIIDLFGGLSDLKNKILRAVGDPQKRFKEDALRILRLFRFASQLDFKIEEKTLNSALKLQCGLENISRERIFIEIQKAVAGKNPKALAPLISSGGLEFLGIKALPPFKTQNPDLRFFELLSVNNNPIEILKGLKASNKLIEFTEKMLLLSTLEIKTKADIKNALFLTDVETVKVYFRYANKKDTWLKEILENDEPYLISHLAVTGADLTNLGFKGKEIGERLETLRQAVVKDPQKNKKATLLALTK
ncbi:MAG: CCA tRNA nucleotidyltransferase [Clostridia bacterium]|nr:CCA tRNA nucleotidyltransferase [Clostridia bacterium]